MKRAFSFDDVVLIPQYSEIQTRDQVDLSTKLGSIKLNCPIISANMDSITETDMAIAMAKSGGLGMIHRYQSQLDIIRSIQRIKQESQDFTAIPSIGVKKEDYKMLAAFRAAGADAICIDVAHGDHKAVIDMCKEATKYFENIICGNVVTYDAAFRLIEAGANILKIGIGNGSLCSTRIVTGHGLPQITALLDVCRIKQYIPAKHKPVTIISDGGIKNSGDCVKALACGADAIMIGSLFAGCDETPSINGVKQYRGMASKAAREAFFGTQHKAVPEGEAAGEVKSKGSVQNVINELLGGIRSGLSYSGARTISELHKLAQFAEVTNSGYIEGTPHFKAR